MRHALTFTLAAAAFAVAASAASAQPVSDVLQARGLIGSFALDCTKPVGPNNHYIVHRALGNGSAQRDLMVGPETRQYVYIIDRASVSSAGEVAVSMGFESRRLDMTLRVEGKRMRTVESGAPGGAKVITAGKFANGGEAPWYSKCD